MDVLFQRPDLQVRSAKSFGSDVCFVTFDSYSDVGTLDRPAFAESFLHGRGIDAVHILSRSNDWYLYPYSAEAFAVARAAVAGYARVITYGSSMGAYAAIRFGGRVGAQLAIAMSPQFSINPATPPFEKRWQYDAQAIDFSIEAGFAADFVAKAIIFYDPRNDDRLHVDCFRSLTEVVDVAIPNGGHPVTTILAEIGLLQDAIVDIVAGTFDRTVFVRRLRADRRRSAQLYFNIASNCRRPDEAVRFARKAQELRPGHVQFSTFLGALLLRARKFDEARATLYGALETHAHDQALRYRVSEWHEVTGDLDTAVAIMDELVREFPLSRNNALRLEFLLDEMVEASFKRLMRDGTNFRVLVEA